MHCIDPLPRAADESKLDSSQSLLQDYVLRQLWGAQRKNDASMRNKNVSFLSNYLEKQRIGKNMKIYLKIIA